MTALASFIVAFAFSFAFAQKAETPHAPRPPSMESDTVPYKETCKFVGPRNCWKQQTI